MSIDLLPNELILNILTFLNFRDKDILNSRLINKQICFVVDEPITTQGYPDVISNSLYFFTMEYLFFVRDLEENRRMAEKEFDKEYVNMLIDKSWI